MLAVLVRDARPAVAHQLMNSILRLLDVSKQQHHPGIVAFMLRNYASHFHGPAEQSRMLLVLLERFGSFCLSGRETRLIFRLLLRLMHMPNHREALLSSQSNDPVSFSIPTGFLSGYRSNPHSLLKSLCRMARNGKEPSYIEFDLSKSGSAWIQIPSQAMPPTPIQWQPPNGYTFMCWLYIDSYSRDEQGQSRRVDVLRLQSSGGVANAPSIGQLQAAPAVDIYVCIVNHRVVIQVKFTTLPILFSLISFSFA